jgi:hypothetical protein
MSVILIVQLKAENEVCTQVSLARYEGSARPAGHGDEGVHRRWRG